MVFVASFNKKKKKMVIGNRVRVKKLYQRYRASCIDEVGEVLSPAGAVDDDAGTPSTAMITVPNTRAAAGEVENPTDDVDATAVHD
jgi:hypothetical protein